MKITIQFQHKRFDDNIGSAELYLPAAETNYIVNKLDLAIIEQMIELSNRIEKYE